MAQLLSPVCTDPIKFQSTKLLSCSRNNNRFGSNNSSSSSIMSKSRSKRVLSTRVKVATDDPIPFLPDALADDYYAVLGLLPDATPEQIKKAYYNCMKSCHPDLSGNDPETTNFCMFINEVYEDHVFVDEFSCIGCKNCANVCSDVFMIEEDFGRARACNQRGSTDLVQEAIDSCPVDCIHWTSAAQLSLLEDEMRRVERVNVALMLAGMGSSADVFRMANSRWEKRQNKVLEQARMRMMKSKHSKDKADTYWSNLWGNGNNQRSTGQSEEEVKERASRAAAAARRWREYSRRGVGKPASYKLPDTLSTKEK